VKVIVATGLCFEMQPPQAMKNCYHNQGYFEQFQQKASSIRHTG